MSSGILESSVKYRSRTDGRLTPCPKRAAGHCQRVSLTGAVSSQNVTEEFEGALGVVGNHAIERKGRRAPDCEADKPSRRESGT